MTRSRTSAAALLVLAVALGRCTGGSETSAAVGTEPPREAPAPTTSIEPRRELARISSSIPVYQGAKYREDLTSRDAVMIRSRYGPGARVFTLATDDSFPQVYHYYTTYLAQFRSFPVQDPWPPGRNDWRTLELRLNQVMQDPFIPGQSLDPAGPQVTLQVAETEAEPRTIIRYIVTPPAEPAVAVHGPPAPAAAVTASSGAAPAAPLSAPVR